MAALWIGAVAMLQAASYCQSLHGGGALRLFSRGCEAPLSQSPTIHRAWGWEMKCYVCIPMHQTFAWTAQDPHSMLLLRSLSSCDIRICIV